MKVDFHVHSTASDGTAAPRTIAHRAMTRGFDAIALTDHDNCDGIGEFLSYKYDPADDPPTDSDDERVWPIDESVPRVAGIELSIEPGEGFDRFHLLGLGIDPDNPALKVFIKRIIDGRNERNDKIFDNFRRIGIEIPREGLSKYAKGEILARPHFARWLVDNRLAADVRDAFGRYLLAVSPPETRCYEPRWRPSQEEAFAAIHGAGGVTIMAHPKFWRNEWRSGGPDYDVAERELLRLKEVGLDGIEAVYEANLPREDLAFTIVAEHTGLLKSIGSDYHGANKPNIRLGMTVEEVFIAPLMERLGLR